MELSHLVNSIEEPQTIMMAKLSRAMKAEGIPVVDLSLGEPDFATPEHIKAAAKVALDAGFTKYPPVAGYPELRQAICQKLERDNKLQYEPNQIIVSTGAKQSLSNVFQAIINPGDEVIIPTPFWVTYATQVIMCGGKPVFITCDAQQNYKLKPEQLKDHLTTKTKAIVYSSPCNPSGAVYSQSELAALKDVLVEYPAVFVVSDEIYEFINFTDKHYSMAHFPELKDRTIIINGMSKGYAMTGWRLGYMAAHSSIATACEKIQSQTTSGANTIAERAAIEALTGDQTTVGEMKTAYQERRDYFIPALQKISGFQVNIPEGAFYAFVNIGAYIGKTLEGELIQNSTDFAMYLLKHAKVTGIPGIAFGDDASIRFSFATSMENLEQAIQNLSEKLGTKN